MTKSTQIYRISLYLISLLSLLILSVNGVLRQQSEGEEYIFNKVQIYSDFSDRVYFSPCSAADASDTDTLYFFLPYPSFSCNYTISFPVKDQLLIDDTLYHPGPVLPSYEDGAYHDLVLKSGGKLFRQRICFMYADNLPIVSISAKEQQINDVLANKYHTDFIFADVAVLDPNLHTSVYDQCEFAGHGGSTWETDKKSFEFKIPGGYSLLGMKQSEKWTLLGNGMDYSNIKNKIVYTASQYMHTEFPTECEYVNFYINGKYQGLYLLSGRPSPNGGMIDLPGDLFEENKLLNALTVPSAIVINENSTDEDKYFNFKNNPADITGSYYMEFVQYGEPQGRQDEKSWFLTDRMMIKIKSPKFATEKELKYIKDYTAATERAIFSPDGIDPESGADFHDRIDMHSWAVSYLFMDFFGNQDRSAGSLFFYKKRNDPVFYSGPIWDYDKAISGDFYDEDPLPWYGQATYYVVYEADDKYELWHSALNRFPDFHEQVVSSYSDELAPAMDEIFENKLPDWLELTAASAHMDEFRWSREQGSESESANEAISWLRQRKALFDRVWINGEYSPYAENIY